MYSKVGYGPFRSLGFSTYKIHQRIFFYSEGSLDPRELIQLYPAMAAISPDFKSERPAVSNTRDLRRLSRDDWPTFQQYLSFLCHFLREIRGTAQGLICPQDIDTALFKLYLEQEDYENLDQLVTSQNDCVLQVCAPELENHKR